MADQRALGKVVNKTSTALSIGIGVGVIAAIGVGLYYLIGYCTRCPRCKSWWTVEVTKRTLLKEENKSKDVEREDEHFDSKGIKTGTTKRQERVYIIEKTYDVDKRCTKCSQSWVDREIVNT